MARAMSPEKEQEFVELEAFLDFYATAVMGIDPANDIHPATQLRGIAAQVGKSKALVGLRQAVNDCLEWVEDATPEEISALDSALKSRGIVTFTELMVRKSRKYRAVLKRGRIRNDTEYYIVDAAASDLSIAMPEDERRQLDCMLAGYRA